MGSGIMRGQMMEMPLLISSLIEHAGRVHPNREVITRTVEGPIHRSNWGEVRRRSKLLASKLEDSGIARGDRLATLAWNTHRHVEVYYGVAGLGAVCHTLNPRLHPSELAYIINHAEDRVLFLDLTFVPLAEALADKLPTIERYVLLTDSAHMPETSLKNAVAYEDFINGGNEDFSWPQLDESTAASLCYTSGTTGNPKGVLYHHRSTVLHAWAICMHDVFDLHAAAVCLPIVPMFHACAWGIPYAAAASGTKLVMPGPRMDPEGVTELLESEGVTHSAAVPSVFLGLVEHWRAHRNKPASLGLVLMGGSAPPRSLIAALEGEFGVDFRHAWGLTETSPLGTVNTLSPEHRRLPVDERTAFQTKQGQPSFGIELRIVGEDGTVLPHDGVAIGELQARGPWVIDGYYRSEERKAHGRRMVPDG